MDILQPDREAERNISLVKAGGKQRNITGTVWLHVPSLLIRTDLPHPH